MILSPLPSNLMWKYRMSCTVASKELFVGVVYSCIRLDSWLALASYSYNSYTSSRTVSSTARITATCSPCSSSRTSTRQTATATATATAVSKPTGHSKHPLNASRGKIAVGGHCSTGSGCSRCCRDSRWRGVIREGYAARGDG